MINLPNKAISVSDGFRGAPRNQSFLDFLQFLEKFNKFISWCPLRKSWIRHCTFISKQEMVSPLSATTQEECYLKLYAVNVNKFDRPVTGDDENRIFLIFWKCSWWERERGEIKGQKKIQFWNTNLWSASVFHKSIPTIRFCIELHHFFSIPKWTTRPSNNAANNYHQRYRSKFSPIRRLRHLLKL